MLRSMLAATLAFATSAGAADFHLSPAGDDAAAGSLDRPWRSVERANRQRLRPGDRILLRGGATFRGGLVLDRDDSGDPAGPVVIASYGGGRAIVDGGDGSAVVVRGVEHAEVRDLVVVGSGRNGGNRQGRGVEVEGSRSVVVEDVEVRGFQLAGVRVGASRDVRVVGVDAVANGFAGIFAEGCTRLRVDRCRAIGNAGDPTIRHNHSGSGILFYDTTDSVIERSEAAGNGGDQPIGPPNGPVGIWTARCDRVTIQACVSHDNLSTSGDGGGFDLDGGTRDSTIQHCYSYRNRNVGYLVWEYGSGRGITGNTIRHCISVDDRLGGFRVGTSGPGGVDGLEIHHNLAINRRDPAVRFDEGDVRNVRLRSNIFVVGPGVEVVQASPAARYEGNLYWRPDGGFRVAGFASLEAWAGATGQETVDGRVIGVHADPRLVDATAAPPPARPGFPSDLAAYRLRAGSPCIDRGLDLRARFGVDPGPVDFFERSIPQGSGFDIGPHEAPPGP